MPIHVWHAFFGLAFGLSLDESASLIASGRVLGTQQVFQAPGGAITRKIIYKFPYFLAYPLGESVAPPRLVADQVIDKTGHILPYVRFEGGSMRLAPEAVARLHRAATDR